MRTTIDARFSDSRSADLSLAFGLEPLPALGTHHVRLHGLDFELRVLGTSHQVLIGSWSETVACLPDRAGTLPSREETVVNGLRVQFGSQILRLGGVALADRVVGIVRDCAADGRAIVGEFPGFSLAITALRAWEEQDGSAAWRTWHSYPQAGELVETRTVVRQA